MLHEKLTSQSVHSNQQILIPYAHLRSLVETILRSRIRESADVEDIAQDVFRRSWQWARRHNKSLSEPEWKKLIARITFNEISRFYKSNADRKHASYRLDEELMGRRDETAISPQMAIELADQLSRLSFRQRLSIILHGGEILPYLHSVIPLTKLSEQFGIEVGYLRDLLGKLPLSENEIVNVIEELTMRKCRSSIRDERSKGRKILRERMRR